MKITRRFVCQWNWDGKGLSQTGMVTHCTKGPDSGSSSEKHPPKHCTKTISDSPWHEPFQNVDFSRVETWPETSSLQVTYRAPLHTRIKAAAINKSKAPLGALRRQWTKGKSCSPTKIFLLWRRHSTRETIGYLLHVPAKLLRRHLGLQRAHHGVCYDGTTELHFCEQRGETFTKVYQDEEGHQHYTVSRARLEFPAVLSTDSQGTNNPAMASPTFARLHFPFWLALCQPRSQSPGLQIVICAIGNIIPLPVSTVWSARWCGKWCFAFECCAFVTATSGLRSRQRQTFWK